MKSAIISSVPQHSTVALTSCCCCETSPQNTLCKLRNLTHAPTYAKGSKEWMAEVLNSLPADPPTREHIKPFIIPDTDKRVGLRGQFGLKIVRPPLKKGAPYMSSSIRV